jgi:hypothetical protein
MTTRNSLTKLIAAVLGVGFIAVVWSSWGTGDVGAADHRDRRGFGLVSLNPGQVARLNIFSLRINENQTAETQSNAEEARPRRISIAFDVYASGSETNKASAAVASDTSCPRSLQFVTRRSCDIVLARGDAVTWDFTVPAEGAVIRAVVNPASFDPHIISSLEIMEGGRTMQFINPNVIDP